MRGHRDSTSCDRPTEAEGRESDEDQACRRAYYRVMATLPIRLTPLPEDEIEGAIFELSMPSSIAPPPVAPGDEESMLFERLRRIEEKLDLLLGEANVDIERPLGGADLELLVFSGSGLSLQVDHDVDRGAAFRVEILLPAPDRRLVRGIGRAVEAAKPAADGVARYDLALSLDHMIDEDRDALVAFSYDLQRVALRARESTEMPS